MAKTLSPVAGAGVEGATLMMGRWPVGSTIRARSYWGSTVRTVTLMSLPFWRT